MDISIDAVNTLAAGSIFHDVAPRIETSRSPAGRGHSRV
jgi:hypothetical protein